MRVLRTAICCTCLSDVQERNERSRIPGSIVWTSFVDGSPAPPLASWHATWSTHLPRLRCSEGFWKLERAWRVCMLRKVVLCTRPVWVCEFLSCWTVWTSISIGSTPIVGTTLLRNHNRACSILSLLLLIFKCAYHGLWAHVGSFVLRAVCARYCAVYAIPSVAMCRSTCQVGTSATFRLYDTSTALNCTITP